MPNRKPRKLADSSDLNIETTGPFTDGDIIKRQVEYEKLSDVEFRKAWRHYLFQPAKIKINNKEHEIQYNLCANPFCKWFGLPQKKYDGIKSKPSRYKQVSGKNKGDVVITCNMIDDPTLKKECIAHYNSVYSNWGVCDEIKRLISINSTIPKEPVYKFHRDGCPNKNSKPNINPSDFYKRGKSGSNSQKYQCKACKKITNLLPYVEQSFNYHQQRNDIMIEFTKDVLSRAPVRRTCEKLGIGSQTYYAKLELLYQRCLEFLERHETKVLECKKFDQITISSDFFIYHLNNTKQKGIKTRCAPLMPEEKFPTYIMTSAEVSSGYVLRSDVAYDFNVQPDDIISDTLENKSDHTYSYLRRFDRLTDPYSCFPMPPTQLDSQNHFDYQWEKSKFEARTHYVVGSHVKSTYTAMAHYWLLRNSIIADKWDFVSDNDSSLITSAF